MNGFFPASTEPISNSCGRCVLIPSLNAALIFYQGCASYHYSNIRQDCIRENTEAGKMLLFLLYELKANLSLSSNGVLAYEIETEIVTVYVFDFSPRGDIYK